MTAKQSDVGNHRNINHYKVFVGNPGEQTVDSVSGVDYNVGREVEHVVGSSRRLRR